MEAIRELDAKISIRVRTLNGIEKNDVLNYIERIPKKRHSTRLYRRKAMKQIQQALRNQ